MSDRNILDFNGLQEYDNNIKDYISRQGEANYAPVHHVHYLNDIGFTEEHGTIPNDDVYRLKAFRNCQDPFLNAAGNITIDTDAYDIAYIEVSGDVNITLKIGTTEGSPASHARCLKILIKNAHNHNITWNYSNNFIWRDNDAAFSDEANKVDIIELITAGLDANGDVAEVNPTSNVIWYGNITKSY